MSRDEFNYMCSSLKGAYENVLNVRSVHEVYYIRGIISTLEDVLYKFCEPNMLTELNTMVLQNKNNWSK